MNCQNGLVDVMTGKLFPHDPEVMTLFQLPVSYDPKATCPKYEAWLEERLPGQTDALEDAACQVLDRTRTAQRFIFLFGPPRSGKSTFLRILLALVGKQNTSSVTLHQLSDDRFASANLYGKVLNVAADLSSRDVKDLSSLKMLTGEDQIQGNRKYGAQFSFTSQALLAFSANDVPTVNDPTGAYQERALPFHFAEQLHREENDPQIERRHPGGAPRDPEPIHPGAAGPPPAWRLPRRRCRHPRELQPGIESGEGVPRRDDSACRTTRGNTQDHPLDGLEVMGQRERLRGRWAERLHGEGPQLSGRRIPSEKRLEVLRGEADRPRKPRRRRRWTVGRQFWGWW